MATGRQDPRPRLTPHGPASEMSGTGQQTRAVRLSKLAHGRGMIAPTFAAKNAAKNSAVVASMFFHKTFNKKWASEAVTRSFAIFCSVSARTQWRVITSGAEYDRLA